MADHKSFTIATNVQVYFCDHAVLGSAAATRAPTACCDSISRGEQISGWSQLSLVKGMFAIPCLSGANQTSSGQPLASEVGPSILRAGAKFKHAARLSRLRVHDRA
jgi:hypothetical protein